MANWPDIKVKTQALTDSSNNPASTEFVAELIGLTHTIDVVATVALEAGDFVNIYTDAPPDGLKCRLAEGSTDYHREAHGFVRSAVATLSTATIYLPGTINDQVGYYSPNPGLYQYLSASFPGKIQEGYPYSAGQMIQQLGKAISDHELLFYPKPPIGT